MGSKTSGSTTSGTEELEEEDSGSEELSGTEELELGFGAVELELGFGWLLEELELLELLLEELEEELELELEELLEEELAELVLLEEVPSIISIPESFTIVSNTSRVW